jgi:hypothetical protein
MIHVEFKWCFKMADEVGFAILSSILELLSVTVNFCLRKLGYDEISVKKLSVIIGWIIVFVGILFLFWLTISYS